MSWWRESSFAVVVGLVLGAAIASTSIHGERRSLDLTARQGLRTGDEIIVVFIGASFCGGTKRPGLKETVREMNRLLTERAHAVGYGSVTIGVALDWSIEEGLSFLREFGPFDEIAVGRNWLNVDAIRYIWKDLPGSPTLPQVVVVHRHVDVGAVAVDVGVERLLVRKLGADRIEQWVSAGAVLPSLAATREPQ